MLSRNRFSQTGLEAGLAAASGSKRRRLTVEQRLLDFFPTGHYEWTILENSLIQRFSRDLNPTHLNEKDMRMDLDDVLPRIAYHHVLQLIGRPSLLFRLKVRAYGSYFGLDRYCQCRQHLSILESIHLSDAAHGSAAEISEDTYRIQMRSIPQLTRFVDGK